MLGHLPPFSGQQHIKKKLGQGPEAEPSLFSLTHLAQMPTVPTLGPWAGHTQAGSEAPHTWAWSPLSARPLRGDVELVIPGSQTLYVFMGTPRQLPQDQSSLHQFRGAGPELGQV